ncbi:MAG: hypothetical protein R3D78_11495 [Paracoccaceae bacterium]
MTPLPEGLVTRLAEAAGAPEGVHSLEALADLWLADHRADPGEEPAEPLWSDLCVFELGAHPQACLAFCLRALRKAETLWQVGLVAAGPLEELLAEHGAEVIAALEDQARRAPRIAYALTGIWTDDLPADIAARLEAARAPMMAQGLDSGAPLPPA